MLKIMEKSLQGKYGRTILNRACRVWIEDCLSITERMLMKVSYERHWRWCEHSLCCLLRSITRIQRYTIFRFHAKISGIWQLREWLMLWDVPLMNINRWHSLSRAPNRINLNIMKRKKQESSASILKGMEPSLAVLLTFTKKTFRKPGKVKFN